MSLLRYSIIALSFIALFTVSTFAQANGKVAVIDTRVFASNKVGITRLINERTELENKFKPIIQELTTILNKINEFNKQFKMISCGNFDSEVLQAKIDEYDKLVQDYKFKQEEAKAKFERDVNTQSGSVTNDIFKALKEFSKQKGYTMVLDIAKAKNTKLILYFDEKVDITAEFIKFYKARSAGTVPK